MMLEIKIQWCFPIRRWGFCGIQWNKICTCDFLHFNQILKCLNYSSFWWRKKKQRNTFQFSWLLQDFSQDTKKKINKYKEQGKDNKSNTLWDLQYVCWGEKRLRVTTRGQCGTTTHFWIDSTLHLCVFIC